MDSYRLPSVFFARDSITNTNISANIFKKSEIVSGQNTSGRQDSPVMNNWGALTPKLFVTRKIFL